MSIFFGIEKRRIRLANASLTDVLVQGDHNAEECIFTFGPEHNGLISSDMVYKLIYYRADSAGRDVTLEPVSGTTYLTLKWVPDRYATAISGPFAFTLVAYKEDLTFTWNSDPFTLQIVHATTPAVSVDPDELGQSIPTMYANLAARVYVLEHATLDEIDRGYYDGTNFYSDAAHTTLLTPDSEKLYIDIPTGGLYTYFDKAYHSASIDLSNYYNKSEVDALLDKKADGDMVYSKTAADNKFVAKESGKSLMTTAQAEKLADLPDADGLETLLSAKYEKPATGVPKSDLASDVQTSLGKADTALQEHQSLALYSLSADTGYRLDLEIDGETFVITPKMYNKAGALIATGKAVDLPLEAVVVDASYDSKTKKIILTLKNGNTIEVPVSSLISGLVTESYFTETLKNYQENQYLSTDWTSADNSHYPSAKLVKDGLDGIEDKIGDLRFKETDENTFTLDCNAEESFHQMMLDVPAYEQDAIMLSLEPDIPTADSHNFGLKGQIATDGTYLYVCTDTNTWKKVALSDL